MTSAEHFWRAPDGLKLFARDYAGDGAKLPVICIPGLTRNSRDFEDAAPWIAAQGRRVLAVDLRGRGRSDRDPSARSYNPRKYADDVGELLRSIGAPRGLLIGTSLGGIVAMALAARKPKLVGGAVLNDSGPQVAAAGLARISAYVGNNVDIRSWDDATAYAKRINGPAIPSLPDDAWSIFARRMFREDANGRPVLDYDPAVFKAPSKLALRVAQPLAWAAFKRLSKVGPITLIRGELSDVIDADIMRRMQLKAPNMAVAEVPDVGHAPLLTEPDAQAALKNFLERAP